MEVYLPTRTIKWVRMISAREGRIFPRINGSYLVLELSNLCNLTCVHCAVSEANHPHHHSTGHIEVSVVDALIADMVENTIQFDVLILFWLGEPLLHPAFNTIYRRFVRAIHQHGIFKSIEVHTNSILLDAAKRRLFLNELDVHQKIHCTIDAFHPTTYKAIKGRDVLPELMNNVEAFILEKYQLGSRNPRIVLQYIVGSNNVDEIEPFLEHWVGVAKRAHTEFFVSAGQIPDGDQDGIFFRQLDCPTEEEQHREGEVFVRAMQQLGIQFPQQPPALESIGLQPCSGFWKSPTIDWKGNLTMCTRDNTLENSLGNILETSFSKLWWGTQQQRNRQRVSEADYSELTLCQTCFVPQSCNHSGISVDEIREYTLEAE